MRSFGLLRPDEIENSPSAQDGLDKETIFKYGRSSCIYIQKVAESLRLRLITISTAKVFFWRYFARQSFKTHDRWVVAITCIFLSSKVEEDLRKLKEVVVVARCVKTGNNDKAAVAEDPIVQKTTDKVLVCERILLHTLSFDVNVIHPHNIAVKYVKKINGGPKFRQTVWNFMNDSSNTNLCLRYSPEQIAAAGVILAAHYFKARGTASSKDASEAIANLDKEQAENDGKVFGFAPNNLKEIASELLTVFEPVEALFVKKVPKVEGDIKPEEKKRTDVGIEAESASKRPKLESSK